MEASGHNESVSKKDSVAARKIRDVQEVLTHIDPSTVKKADANLQGASLSFADGTLYDPEIEPDEYPTNITWSFSDGSRVQVFPEEGSEKAELDRLYRNYSDTIGKIMGVAKRQLDPDRKMQVIANLERERGNIHRRGVEQIEQHLDMYEGVTVTNADPDRPNTGKKLFEAYFLMQQYQEPNTLFYKEDDLRGRDLQGIVQRVAQETGLSISVDVSVWGFHTGVPKKQYTLSIPGATVVEKSIVEDKISSLLEA